MSTPDRSSRTRPHDEIGRLARRLAHDLNNIFTVIQGAAELARVDAGQDPEGVRESATTIVAAQQEGSRLVRQLLAFAGPREPVVERFPPAAEIRELSEVLQIRLGEDVALELDLHDGVHVAMDRESFRQLLLSIAAWAREALPRGGQLRVTMPSAAEGRGPGAAHLTVTAQRDDAEPAAGFSGLAFATVRRIVNRAEGRLSVDSVQEAGTAVRVSLPTDIAEPPDAIPDDT